MPRESPCYCMSIPFCSLPFLWRKRTHCQACQSKPASSQRSGRGKTNQVSTHQVIVGEETPPVRSPSPEIKDHETYTLFSMARKTRPIVVAVSVDSKPTSLLHCLSLCREMVQTFSDVIGWRRLG